MLTLLFLQSRFSLMPLSKESPDTLGFNPLSASPKGLSFICICVIVSIIYITSFIIIINMMMIIFDC